MKKYIKILFSFILFSVFCGNIYAQEIDVNDTTIYSKDDVDAKPQFVGGDKALYKWLNENIEYPITAMESSIQGKVYCGFVVEKDGLIINIEITKSVHILLDKEVIRLVRKMPKWTPAIKNGKIVRCYFILPVTFRLK